MLLSLLPRLILPLTPPLLLTACGDLPEPFLGNPGAMARRLAVPDIPPMLAVQPPTNALLSPQAKADFADLLALSLQKDEVPSLARKPEKTDWRLAVSAQRKGDLVVPHYVISDPTGHQEGAIDGAAFPAAGWTEGAPKVLGQAADDAVPKILALMLSIRRTRDRANPSSLLNRSAKLFVPIVTGAPGDGDPALTRLIRADLAQFGPLIQDTPDGADFVITGKVIMTKLPKGQQQVEIAWTVTRPDGKVVGKVSQLNSIPDGMLDHYWGDVAGVVAQEASAGVNEVVQRFIGKDETGPDGKTAAGSGPAQSDATGAKAAAGPAAHSGHDPATVALKGTAAEHRAPPGEVPARAVSPGSAGGGLPPADPAASAKPANRP